MIKLYLDNLKSLPKNEEKKNGKKESLANKANKILNKKNKEKNVTFIIKGEKSLNFSSNYIRLSNHITVFFIGNCIKFVKRVRIII